MSFHICWLALFWGQMYVIGCAKQGWHGSRSTRWEPLKHLSDNLYPRRFKCMQVIIQMEVTIIGLWRGMLWRGMRWRGMRDFKLRLCSDLNWISAQITSASTFLRTIHGSSRPLVAQMGYYASHNYDAEVIGLTINWVKTQGRLVFLDRSDLNHEPILHIMKSST